MLTPHELGRMTVYGEDLAARPGAVMAFGETTLLLWQAAEPPARIGNALDLGCGAGALALLLSRRAGRVIGVDFNLRAVDLARRNAAHNAVDNAWFRWGDGFQPVEHERFHLIVSQPPFLPLPPGAAADVTLHGGPRGDEIALRWLRQSVDYLTGDGVAVFLFDRPAGAAPSAPGLWILGPEIPAAEYAAEYAALLPCPVTEAMRPCLVVRRRQDTEAVEWPVPAESWKAVTRRRIDEILASRALADAPPEVLRATPLETAEGAARVVRTSPYSTEEQITFAPGALLMPVVDASVWPVLSDARHAPPGAVRDALRRGWLRPISASV